MNKRFLLDTNVLSELMKNNPEKKVIQWFDAHQHERFFTSSITKAEILLGIALLPKGRRQKQLYEATFKLFSTTFLEYCFPFCERAAVVYSDIVAHQKRIGRGICTEDAQIAAIALTENLTLATRNVKDFHFIQGLEISNPWHG
uniref:PIN (PilT N terminus) domain n=1 Tax=Chlorobium chlorochromatii (strain CaD3) TaxID=340177 RepID=Q3APP7_CHLCH